MKNLIISLLLTLSLLTTVFGQDFVRTEKFKLTDIKQISDSSYYSLTADEQKNIVDTLFLYEEPNDKSILYKFCVNYDPVSEFDYQIFELKNPNLRGVKNIIQVRIDSYTCCSTVNTYYLFINDNGSIHELPNIEYVYCDGQQPFLEYRFPSQKFGQENKILRTKSFPNENWVVDSVQVEVIYELKGLNTFDN